MLDYLNPTLNHLAFVRNILKGNLPPMDFSTRESKFVHLEVTETDHRS